MRRVVGGFARGAARRLESILSLAGWPARELAGWLELELAAGPIEVLPSRRRECYLDRGAD